MTTRVSRRPSAAVFMLLLLLAAGLLYSAQSAPHPAPSASAYSAQPEAHSPVVHDHQHGNEWSPLLGKRLRPVSASGVAVVHAPLPPVVTAGPVELFADPPPASNSILRV
jgi:hypothetical protein